MNETDQRIAIAEACGWRECKYCPPDGGWVGKFGLKDYWVPFPDYLQDLNACHEMEEILPQDKRADYMDNLTKETRQLHDMLWDFTHASAPQRCEAFLRTIGKWKE